MLAASKTSVCVAVAVCVYVAVAVCVCVAFTHSIPFISGHESLSFRTRHCRNTEKSSHLCFPVSQKISLLHLWHDLQRQGKRKLFLHLM